MVDSFNPWTWKAEAGASLWAWCSEWDPVSENKGTDREPERFSFRWLTRGLSVWMECPSLPHGWLLGRGAYLFTRQELRNQSFLPYLMQRPEIKSILGTPARCPFGLASFWPLFFSDMWHFLCVYTGINFVVILWAYFFFSLALFYSWVNE